MRRQAKVGDTVKIQLSNGPLVQAYGQYNELYAGFKNLWRLGKVVRVSINDRISVEFDERVLSIVEENVKNTHKNGFGKGKLGYCLYFEAFSKFPYEVIEEEPEEVDQAALDSLERFRHEPWQFVETDYFASEAKTIRDREKSIKLAAAYGMGTDRIAEHYNTKIQVENLPSYPANLRDQYYSSGVDPYLPVDINLQFVQPLLSTEQDGTVAAYGSTWIKPRRIGHTWGFRRTGSHEDMFEMDRVHYPPEGAAFPDTREDVFGALEKSHVYSKTPLFGDKNALGQYLFPEPLPFLSDHEQQLLLLCP